MEKGLGVDLKVWKLWVVWGLLFTGGLVLCGGCLTGWFMWGVWICQRF